MEARQFSAAIAAIKEIGVLTGFRIERRERGSPGEFEEMSTEQLVSEWGSRSKYTEQRTRVKPAR
jgi:hypothetical protein